MEKTYKELWNEEHEYIYSTLVKAGCSEDMALELADEHTTERVKAQLDNRYKSLRKLFF